MFFRDGPRFKPSVAIIVINHDHDDHHCHYHHLSKELFRYSFFFRMCPLCCPLLFMFLCSAVSATGHLAIELAY